MIEVLKSKIHCARVTEANLNYMGSITIDEDLLDAANMIPGEKVYIADKDVYKRQAYHHWPMRIVFAKKYFASVIR